MYIKKFLRILLVLLTCLSLVSSVCAQQYSYPNEVRGFELFKTGKWKTLIPYVSTKKDVERIFGPGCEKEACDYDDNWRVLVMYVGKVWGYSPSQGKGIQCISEEMIQKYSSLIFYPKNRITRDQLRFGKQFDKGRAGSSHSTPSLIDHYFDLSGLIYAISAENTYDKRYQKGDLFSIQYTYSASDYEKYGNRIACK